jgi:hypothetical protein
VNLLRKLPNLATENRATGAAGSDNEAASLSPLKDPATGKHLPARRQPGYYPGFSTLAQEKYWDAATRMLIHRRVNRSIPIRFFTSDEEKTMHAVVDRVLPQEDREYAYRIDVLAGIDERLFENRLEGYRYADMPPDQDAYRLAARAFEAMAHEQYGQSFHALDITRQETLLRSIHHTEPLAAKELWSQMNIKRFWTMLVADCCSVYYAHPYAWDEIGFGGPAYPRGYMRLEEGEPEPWEVDEQRYEWAAPDNSLSDAEDKQGGDAEHQTHHGQAGTH